MAKFCKAFRDGWLVHLLLLLAAALFGVFQLWIPAAAAFVTWIGAMLFLRDPERVPPQQEGVLVSSADGRILTVSEGDDPDFDGPVKRVMIFMSPLDVHRNRIPVAGEVVKVEHHPGRFHAAYSDAAAMENEHCRLLLNAGKERVAVVQIAGWFARRIVCRVKPGIRVDCGEEFGLIRFGSANQLIFDSSWDVCVSEGERVKAGLTVIARKNNSG